VSGLVRRSRVSVGTCLARSGCFRDVSGDVVFVSGLFRRSRSIAGTFRRSRLIVGTCSAKSD